MDELYNRILGQLPCPVSQLPAGGSHETYATFNQVYGSFSAFSSNGPRRTRHMVQVHIFSRLDDGTHRQLMNDAIWLLIQEGVRVISWGPDEYERETGYHHIAITTECYLSIEEKE